jgi:membrane-associated phospholipid phosphatase
MPMRDHPPPPRLRAPVALALLALACAVFGVFAADLMQHGAITAADAPISAWFHAHTDRAATQALLLVTHLHSTTGICVMAAAAALALAWWRELQWLPLLAITVPGGLVLNALVKHAFQRARPHFDEPLLTLATYSFPSGHAAGATVWWGFVLVWLFAHEPRLPQRALASALAGLMVALTALSRVYLGAHYLSDVLAAIAEGLAWLALCFMVLDRRSRPAGTIHG